MLFRSTYLRVPGSGMHSQNTGIAPMCRLTAISTAVFLACPARVRTVAVKPGRHQSGWLPVALDERGPHMPTENRGAVVAATGVAAG